jgi:hypothetical protein
MRIGLGIALNEADLLGFEVDAQNRVAAATFRVFTLPKKGPAPADSRVQLQFQPVGRVAASLRNGSHDDFNAEVVPFAVEDLLAKVQSFDGLPVYGWEFFDIHEKSIKKLGDRLSLDWRSGDDGNSHSISVFQSPGNRILDIWVWFDEMQVRDPEGNVIPIDSFIADGKRWWDAFYKGDERTRGHGMAPLKR